MAAKEIVIGACIGSIGHNLYLETRELTEPLQKGLEVVQAYRSPLMSHAETGSTSTSTIHAVMVVAQSSGNLALPVGSGFTISTRAR
ncbi:MAG TPA: hypothetical protein VFB08_21545 [Burkholderiales bacterium]|nr:hypothetical protein [Burkholderiales bacterium]